MSFVWFSQKPWVKEKYHSILEQYLTEILLHSAANTHTKALNLNYKSHGINSISSCSLGPFLNEESRNDEWRKNIWQAIKHVSIGLPHFKILVFCFCLFLTNFMIKVLTHFFPICAWMEKNDIIIIIT